MDPGGNSHSIGSKEFRLIFIVAIVYAQCAAESSIISMVLPAVKCDFRIDSGAASYLTSLPLMGSGIGCLWWGVFADVFGRKRAIMISIIVAGGSSIASSISQYYVAFVFLRTIGGFGLAGILTLIFSYLSELLPQNKRDATLSCTELWYTFGMVAASVLSWLIIPLNINYDTDYFRFRSWNLLVLISGILELVCAAFFSSMPETTEFLRQSTPTQMVSVESKSIRSTFRELVNQAALLFATGRRKNTILCGIFAFCVNITYFTISIWLPEIVTRIRYYEEIHSGVDASLCQMTSVYKVNANATQESCAEGYDDEVFISSLAMGLVCLPPSVILALLGKRIGFRFFIVFPQIVCCVGITVLIFMKSSLGIMIISWIFVSFISITIEATWICLVDIFPTRIRAAGCGFTEAVGKLGGLLGNLAFGYLVDLYFIIPVVTFIICLAGTTVISYLLPFGKSRQM